MTRGRASTATCLLAALLTVAPAAARCRALHQGTTPAPPARQAARSTAPAAEPAGGACPPPGLAPVADFNVTSYISAPWFVLAQVPRAVTLCAYCSAAVPACRRVAPNTPLHRPTTPPQRRLPTFPTTHPPTHPPALRRPRLRTNHSRSCFACGQSTRQALQGPPGAQQRAPTALRRVRRHSSGTGSDGV